jgi:hypothetical protein
MERRKNSSDQLDSWLPRGEAARRWLNVLLRGEMRLADLGELGPAEQVTVLLGRTKNGTLRQRKKAAVVLANLRGVPIRTIAACLSISPVSVRKYVRVFTASGLEALFGNGRQTDGRLADSETIRQASSLFSTSLRRRSASTEPLGEWPT